MILDSTQMKNLLILADLGGQNSIKQLNSQEKKIIRIAAENFKKSDERVKIGTSEKEYDALKNKLWEQIGSSPKQHSNFIVRAIKGFLNFLGLRESSLKIFTIVQNEKIQLPERAAELKEMINTFVTQREEVRTVIKNFICANQTQLDNNLESFDSELEKFRVPFCVTLARLGYEAEAIVRERARAEEEADKILQRETHGFFEFLNKFGDFKDSYEEVYMNMYNQAISLAKKQCNLLDEKPADKNLDVKPESIAAVKPVERKNETPWVIITNNSGFDIESISVRFMFSDVYSGRVNKGQGGSRISTVSKNKPLKNGDKITIYRSDISEDTYKCKGVNIFDATGLSIKTSKNKDELLVVMEAAFLGTATLIPFKPTTQEQRVAIAENGPILTIS